MKKADEEEPRPRGRPRVEAPLTSLTTWVPAHEYDRLVRLANARDQSLSAYVRQWLKTRSLTPEEKVVK